MNAPLDKQELMAGLAELEKRMRDSVVQMRAVEPPRRDFPDPDLGQGFAPRERTVFDREARHQPMPAPRLDFAAIEAEVKAKKTLAPTVAPPPAATVAPPPVPERQSLRPSKPIISEPRLQEFEMSPRDAAAKSDAPAHPGRARYAVAATVILALAGLGGGAAYWKGAEAIPQAGLLLSELKAKVSAAVASKEPEIQTEPAAPESAALNAAPANATAAQSLEPAAEGGGPIQESESASSENKPVQEATAAPTPIAAAPAASTPASAAAPAAAPPAAQAQSGPGGLAAAPTAPPAPAQGSTGAADAPPPQAAAPQKAAAKPKKPTSAAKTSEKRHAAATTKPAKPAAARGSGQSHAAQPPVAEVEPPASAPRPTEASGPSGYLNRAQQAVGSITGTVKGWVGLGGGL